MADDFTHVAVEDLRSLAANKSHLLQVLDLEGWAIRILFASVADGNYEISPRCFGRAEAALTERPN
jgi:hypothetical protein